MSRGKSFSVSRAAYERFVDAATARGISVAQLVEQALAGPRWRPDGVRSTSMAISDAIIGKPHPPRPRREPVTPALPIPTGRNPLASRVSIDISEALLELVDDRIERLASEGVESTRPDLFEAAIMRALVAAESAPPANTACAICDAPVAAGDAVAPVGTDGGLRRICSRCTSEHPRSGRLGFSAKRAYVGCNATRQSTRGAL